MNTLYKYAMQDQRTTSDSGKPWGYAPEGSINQIENSSTQPLKRTDEEGRALKERALADLKRSKTGQSMRRTTFVGKVPLETSTGGNITTRKVPTGLSPAPFGSEQKMKPDQPVLSSSGGKVRTMTPGSLKLTNSRGESA